MPFELTILGTSSATPTADRHPTSQYLLFNNRHILLDCGEACQMQLIRYGLKLFRIDMIFISHMHPDHYLGLPGLLSTLALKGRTEHMDIYAPAALEKVLECLSEFGEMKLTYNIRFHPLPETGRLEMLYQNEQMEIACFPVQHRVPCWGFFFREIKPKYRINKEAVTGKGIPSVAFAFLKRGDDFTAHDGRVFSAAEFAIPNNKPSSYAYITDTLYLPELADSLSALAPDLLYHEATFMHELLPKAIETHHSTTLQAAEFAQRCGARRLIIGHFSSRYKLLQPLLDEALQVFPDTVLGEEGARFSSE